MIIFKSNYLRLKALFRRYKFRKIYQIKDCQRELKTLKSVIKEQSIVNENLRKQRQECIRKVAELKNTNEKIRENYQKLSNQKMELQKELKERCEDLRKETFEYNFFSKVASKQMLREAMRKDKE